jgi:hypothetical protein
MTADVIGHSSGYLPLEQDVVRKLLDGPSQTLRALRGQFVRSFVSERQFTGAGFYVTLRVPNADARPGFRLSSISDVVAETERLRYGAGFVLHVRERVLVYLEGFTYGEAWPEEGLGTYLLRYTAGDEREELKAKILAAEGSARG